MRFIIASKRVRLASAAALVAVFVGGCETTAEQASTTVSKQEAACRDALRDVRTWCSESIRESRLNSQYNCLEARLRFDRNCYPG